MLLHQCLLFLSFLGPVWLHWWPPHGNGSNFELSSQCIRVHKQPRRSEQPSSVAFLSTCISPSLQHPWGPITFSCRLSCRKQPVTIWSNFSCKYSRYSFLFYSVINSFLFYSVINTDLVSINKNIHTLIIIFLLFKNLMMGPSLGVRSITVNHHQSIQASSS